MSYNITMNYYDGSTYQELYPSTLLNNINDWNNDIYSKTEIDNKVEQINSSVSIIQSSPIKFVKVINNTVFSVGSNSSTIVGSNIDLSNSLGFVYVLVLPGTSGFTSDGMLVLGTNSNTNEFPILSISTRSTALRGKTFIGTVFFTHYHLMGVGSQEIMYSYMSANDSDAVFFMLNDDFKSNMTFYIRNTSENGSTGSTSFSMYSIEML